MNAREFFEAVSAMRDLQRQYFRTRNADVLRASKAAEREVDAEIARARDLMRQRQYRQQQSDNNE